VRRRAAYRATAPCLHNGIPLPALQFLSCFQHELSNVGWHLLRCSLTAQRHSPRAACSLLFAAALCLADILSVPTNAAHDSQNARLRGCFFPAIKTRPHALCWREEHSSHPGGGTHFMASSQTRSHSPASRGGRYSADAQHSRLATSGQKTSDVGDAPYLRTHSTNRHHIHAVVTERLHADRSSTPWRAVLL